MIKQSTVFVTNAAQFNVSSYEKSNSLFSLLLLRDPSPARPVSRLPRKPPRGKCIFSWFSVIRIFSLTSSLSPLLIRP